MSLQVQDLLNHVGGNWVRPAATDHRELRNPATGELLGRVPLSGPADVDAAVQRAVQAAADWAMVPVVERVRPLFRFRALLEAQQDEIARTITRECGKTFAEAVGELQRGIENVETACGAPSLLQGRNTEDIARGIDEHMIRQPLGVVAAVTPFNFPAMIPLWFLPYAVAAGNAFILKPSEKVPLTSQLLFGLLEQSGLPAGVVQLVHGGKEAVDALLDHPDVAAISFVGSTPVAKYIYSRATANGKRAQCQGGAKNPAVVMPDADMAMTARILGDSAFGCAGQRCLATSQVIAVGAAGELILPALTDLANNRVVGNGLDDGVEMGPVIDQVSKERIHRLIAQGVEEGARLSVDGRDRGSPALSAGSFVHPTVLDQVDPRSSTARTEIFGPVLSVTRAADLDEAIALVNDRAFGNQACLFTASGAAARSFRQRVKAGNVGINLGVAAPMAPFPFSGWGESFFGDLHAQGAHGFEFYTQTKVVIERWPSEWSRRF